MIRTFSSTIRRKEMDAVLTCMVDEKTGPGEINTRLIQSVKEFTGCDGAVAFRSPSIALVYAFRALNVESGCVVMISALAPSWQYKAIEEYGCKIMILDVNENTGLVDLEAVSEGIKNGGQILILHETMGIMPDMESIISCGIPVIEDISHSFGAVDSCVSEKNSDNDSGKKNQADQSKSKKAGMFGIFSVMGLEEFDTITAGGGAVLIAPKRREYAVLKKISAATPRTDMLPDINSALALVQIKEFSKNEQVRKKVFSVYQCSVLSGKSKTFARNPDEGSTIWSFPVILNGSFKDAKLYASKNEVEIRLAYEDSVISILDEEKRASLKNASSLYLRCVLFPLYPRLSSESIKKIANVISTLP